MDDKGEKLWSEQVQESEDKGAVLRPSMNMEKTPPRLKRTAALNNAFAPMAKGKMDVPTENNGAPPDRRRARMATEDEQRSKSIKDKDEEQTGFEPTVTLQRSPVKQPLKPPAAPKKPATKPMPSESDSEPGSPTPITVRPTIQVLNEPTTTLKKQRKAINTLLQTATDMVKQAKAKLKTQNTTSGSKEVRDTVLQQLDRIVIFMEAIYDIEDQMTNVKTELHEIRETLKMLEKTTRCA